MSGRPPRGPATFNQNHANRVQADVAGAAKSVLVEKTGKLYTDLGFEGDNTLSSDEDDFDEDPHARPSAEAASKQRIARLEQELDDLSGNLSAVRLVPAVASL